MTSRAMPFDDLESSPDPLNASVNENRIKSKHKGTRAPRTSTAPLASSSPSKQNRRLSISEQIMDFSSPSKSMVLNTGRPGGVSPWKIKVTVEAEPENGSDFEKLESPSVQRATRTTTTTIPLKDFDAPSPVKRRGRPRKSDIGTNAKAKRSGTPVGTRPQSKRRQSSVALSDTSIAASSTDAVPKKRRGRPRKSVTSEIPEAQTITVQEPEHRQEATGGFVPGTPGVQREQEAGVSVVQDTVTTPQEAIAQMLVPIIQTTLATPQDDPTPKPMLQGASLMPPVERTKGRQRKPLLEYDEDIQFTPPQTEAHKRVRARKGTPHSKVVARPHDSSDEDSEIDTPSGTDEEAPVEQNNVFESSAPAVISDTETVTETETASTQELEEDDEQQDVTTYALDEGATRMPDDTTVLDSENFSMISVDSLPSSGGLSSPSDAQNVYGSVIEDVQPIDQSYLRISPANASAARATSQQAAKSYSGPLLAAPGSSQTKTSPIPPRRQLTPVMGSRSPSNPPAIEPAQFSPSEVDTPKIGRVVRAGAALQGVLEPDHTTPSAQSSQEDTDAETARLDDLFRGFSEGTRRELQAGLRLGEQLARQNYDRQTSYQSSPALSSPIKPTMSKVPAEDIFSSRSKQRKSRMLTSEDQEEYSLPVPPPPSTSTHVQYPSLRVDEPDTHLISPERSEDEMSWRVDTPPVRAQPMITAVNDQGQWIRGRDIYGIDTHTAQPSSSGHRHVVTAINEKGDWIQGAEIVATADEEGKEDYGDIWQQEASRSPSEGPADVESKAPESPRLQDLFLNDGPLKPARGKLPRTWRRKSSSDFNYSDEMEEPEQKATYASSSEEPVQCVPVPLDKGKSRLMTPPSEEESDEPAPTKFDTGKRMATELRFLEEQIIDEEGSDESVPMKLDKGKGKMAEVQFEEEEDNLSDSSDGSDDTGMFFQSHLPNVFNRKRSVELRKRKSEKGDLATLLDDGQSLLPDSSPAPSRRTPARVEQPHLRSTPPSIPSPQTRATRSSPSAQRENGDFDHSQLLDDGENLLPEPSPAPTRKMPAKVEQPHLRSTPPSLPRPRAHLPQRSSSAQRKGEDMESSLLLDDGESLAPESSPLPTAKTPVITKPNLFGSTAPRFAPCLSSPAKSSPLRQEIRPSDSEESYQQATVVDESTLPLPPSSPFHTNVDITMASTASDQQQFRHEMEGVTDDSLRRYREEADAHADAYETQYRTLNEIEEVTEQSRTTHSALMPSSPPAFEDSILKPRRAYTPLFDDEDKAFTPVFEQQDKAKAVSRKTSKVPIIARAPRTKEEGEEVPAPQARGIFSRLSSTLWGTTPAPPSRAEAPPPQHALISQFSPLPKVEPWTKTHYKTLDALYQLHKRDPSLFQPSSTSTTNARLLSRFLATHKSPFVGATYSSWGYTCTMSESLVVLCAVYMQLLTLNDIAEYESMNGKGIQMGDCNPGVRGEVIEGGEVVRRLASVVMGESLRRDERRGRAREVRREEGMSVVWPK